MKNVGLCQYICNKTGLQPVSRPVEQVPLVHPIYRKTVTRKKNGGVRTVVYIVGCRSDYRDNLILRSPVERNKTFDGVFEVLLLLM